MDCRWTACSTIGLSTGCSGTSVPTPGAPSPLLLHYSWCILDFFSVSHPSLPPTAVVQQFFCLSWVCSHRGPANVTHWLSSGRQRVPLGAGSGLTRGSFCSLFTAAPTQLLTIKTLLCKPTTPPQLLHGSDKLLFTRPIFFASVDRILHPNQVWNTWKTSCLKNKLNTET